MFAAPSRKAAAARVARGPRGFDVGAPAPVAEADLERAPLWDLSDAGCRVGSNQWRGPVQQNFDLSLGRIRAGWLRSALAGIRDMERRWREANAPGLRAARRPGRSGAGGPRTRRDGTTLGLLAALGGTFDLDVVASDPASGAERTLDTLSWRQLARARVAVPSPAAGLGEAPVPPLDWWDEPPLY
ncbi:hypothetical protein SO694_000970106 [Aureococcus anophagefferens]|uniref:Uncharacterized protein n=1 Tax=Aureococcus anophagefferens TaxID=44056 RepID=A0ABR1FS83_AURAN